MSKTKDNTIERTPAAIQTDIDQLQARADELGVSIREARNNPKFLDFVTLGGKESERNHIGNRLLPALQAELKAAQLAEAVAEFEALDAQRAGLQAEAAAANQKVTALQLAADAGPGYMKKADALFYRRRGEANLALADALDIAGPLNQQSTALEMRVIAMRKTLVEAGELV